MTTSRSSSVDVLGVVVFARHGDRFQAYPDSSSYTMTDMILTTLGENQAFELGSTLRSRYINGTSASHIQSLSQNLYQNSQVKFKADSGSGEGEVIVDSALAVGQGLYPPTVDASEVLADGTRVNSPMNGYQYVGVETVEPDESISVDGFTDCTNFDKAKTQSLASPEYMARANQSAPFLASIKPVLGGRPNGFKDMWNIFYYLSVQYLHNKDLRPQISSNTIEQARDLANFHQFGIYGDDDPSSVRNIAGRVVIPDILAGLEKIANTTETQSVLFIAGSFKPIISFFRMLGVTKNHPELAGITNFAGALSFEVVRPSNSNSSATSDLYVRMNYKNGTADNDFVPYTMLGRPLGSYNVPLTEFTNALEKWSVSTLADWCNICGVTEARGCDVALAARQTESALASHKYSFNPLASGFIGAASALVLALGVLGALMFLGCLTWRRSGSRSSRRSNSTDGGSHQEKVASLT